MGRPLVVGFYTKDTPYEHEFQTLKLSLEEHGYEHDYLPVENLGSWQKNTQYKAIVIKSMLEKHVGNPILYIDVDAIMLHPPVILDDVDCDIAAVHYARNQELLSGTVYFANTPVCMQVVDRWIALHIQYPDKLPDRRPAWDQRTLALAITDIKACHFVELPQEYTFITELTAKHAKGLNPVILHTRGAKRFKNVIDGKEGYAT